ncbi:MAG TPA: 16S rRNA (cytosine(967)-C(5))-methyltransferase RsmB [Solirubrobacteraceae bacterium]|nr:16S rRNA (cytosine(967)-C(5))-methyltransferase RsmB [Solirubrobacteraceae bacterium]
MSTVTPANGVAPARACAFTVIRRVFERGAYADRALAEEAAGLGPRDRALATRLAYGTIQRRATLDHVAAALVGRSLDALDPPVLAALRLGLFQILLLAGVADHAAVNESVELAKAARGGGFKLVNAVLRRATREGETLLDALDDDTPEGAAILHSVPAWLACLWWTELGPETARALLARINEPPESALRVNALVATAEEVLAHLPVPARTVPEIPEALIIDGPFDAYGSPLWRAGAIMPQSRASMLVARMLAPEPGERVLDLCAAPGGKTTHLAALMAGAGEIVAVERSADRVQSLRQTCTRMHAACVRVEHADAAVPRDDEAFDRVLVDPPCSGLGTLQSRPDIRWRGSLHNIGALAAIQTEILAAGAQATAPGGVLVYSVCTITKAEGEAVIAAMLAERPDFILERQVQLMPHEDGTDGFFLARLRRSEEEAGGPRGVGGASVQSTTLPLPP